MAWFQKRHYVVLAEILATEGAELYLIDAFAGYFKADNPNFKANEWYIACDVKEPLSE